MHESNRERPAIDSLDRESLKALVLDQQSQLDSRAAEIENLSLSVPVKCLFFKRPPRPFQG